MVSSPEFSNIRKLQNPQIRASKETNVYTKAQGKNFLLVQCQACLAVTINNERHSLLETPPKASSQERNNLASPCLPSPYLSLSNLSSEPIIGQTSKNKLAWMPRKCLQRRGEERRKRGKHVEARAKNYWHEKDMNFNQKKELDIFIQYYMVYGLQKIIKALARICRGLCR